MAENLKKRIIDIYKEKKAETIPEKLFNTTGIVYPANPDPLNTSNFITDYGANAAELDLFAVRLYGSRYFDAILSEEEEEINSEWDGITKAIITSHLSEWSRLYYALSLKYNPIWNVEGTTTTVYGETSRTDSYAEREDTTTLGAALTTSTDYATSYDSLTEKETGKNTLDEPERENGTVYGAHDDIFTSEEHTDTETRSGNIGVTMTQQMLEAEWKFRQKSFFSTIIKTIMDEAGTHYYSGGWKK